MPTQTFTRAADNQAYNRICNFLYYHEFVSPESYKMVADKHVHSSTIGDTGGCEMLIRIPRFQDFALVFNAGFVIDLLINDKQVVLTFGDESVEVYAADFDDAMTYLRGEARRITDEQIATANAKFAAH